MIKEHDIVVLNKNISEHKLIVGDIGTVVMVYKSGNAYEVEFNTLQGKHISVVTVKANDLRPIQMQEIAHVRKITKSKKELVFA